MYKICKSVKSTVKTTVKIFYGCFFMRFFAALGKRRENFLFGVMSRFGDSLEKYFRYWHKICIYYKIQNINKEKIVKESVWYGR